MTAVDECSTTLGTARRPSCLAALPSAASSFQLESLPTHSNLADASFQMITVLVMEQHGQKLIVGGCMTPYWMALVV